MLKCRERCSIWKEDLSAFNEKFIVMYLIVISVDEKVLPQLWGKECEVQLVSHESLREVKEMWLGQPSFRWMKGRKEMTTNNLQGECPRAARGP